MKSRILMFFTIALMGIAGCSDPCDDAVCLNGATCDDGTCICPLGFSGEHCETAVDPCSQVTCDEGQVCNSGECHNLPAASFTFTPNGCTAACNILFTSTSTDATSYSWNFGDGGTSTEANPTHEYLTGSTYTVVLTATNSYGSTTQSQQVLIQANTQQQLPNASFTITNNNCTEPCAVGFSNTSLNADSYSWNFGDGSNASTNPNPTHTYTSDGVYIVTLSATNQYGSDEYQQTVNIISNPCLGVSCLNGGSCVNGSCNCPDGYSGSNCGTEVSPSSMRITKITVTDFLNDGWDTFPASSPDIYVTLRTGSSCSGGSLLYTSGFYQDAYPGPNYDFVPTAPINISSPTSPVAICLYDDDVSGPEAMGGIYFNPYESGSDFPAMRTISAGDITYKVYFTYYW